VWVGQLEQAIDRGLIHMLLREHMSFVSQLGSTLLGRALSWLCLRCLNLASAHLAIGQVSFLLAEVAFTVFEPAVSGQVIFTTAIAGSSAWLLILVNCVDR
jgi:hypothetical protein